MQLSTIRLRIWRRQCSQICFGHRLSRALWHGLLAAHLVFMAGVQAAPQGGVIRGGHGTISRADLMTHIQQNSQLMAIDWQRFDVAADEQVNFTQPNQQAIALNRILGNNASQIFGQVNANGHLVLVNPRGIFFGDTARVNVGGLIASGLDIDPDRFMNGDFTFSALEGTDGQVINSGLIQAATGGSVTLLGQQVRNDGLIVANLGAVNMAAGTEAVVSFERDGLLGVKITKEVLQEDLGIDPAVLNTGEIQAQGGRVLLTGSVSQDIFSQAVNIGELKEARSAVVHEDGSFTLGAGADVVNKGRIDVSSAASDAGQVVMLGENVTHSGQILADASGYNSENPNSQNQGGQVELHASDTTSLTDDSLIAARSEHGEGGDVFLLGNKVGLFDHSVVDVSGGSQGGQVLIGGDRQGLNSLVRNAEFVYLGEHSQVFADALNHGNGGKVITFAEDTARIYGGLYARGGQQGGDGGFIETSGLRGFEINTVPDVSAVNGQGGLWLIDPYDITVVADCPTGPDCLEPPPPPLLDAVFAPTQESSFIEVDLIYQALQNGNVEITTVCGVLDAACQASTEKGDILWGTNVFSANLDIDSIVPDNTLTLNAAGDIVFVRGAIFDGNTGSADSLNLVLNAGKDITFSDTNNIVINTSGGYLDFTATGAVDLGTATLDTDGGSQAVGSSATPVSFLSNSGSFISTNATINTTGAENTDGGAINITATAGDIQTGVLTTDGGQANRGGGTLGVRGLHGGAITLDASGSVTSNAAINAVGTTGRYNNNEDAGQVGGAGGTVEIRAGTSTGDAITVLDINTSGGNGDGDNGFLPDPADGGNAGDIELFADTINVNGDLVAVGGRAIGATSTDPDPDIPAGISGDGGAVGVKGNSITLNGDFDISAGVVGVGSGASAGEGGTADVIITGVSGSATIGYTENFSSTVNVKVDGAATGSPTLVGADRKNDWDIENTGGGELKNGDVTNVTFSGIGNLTGGSDDDSFVFSNSAAISGTIDGGGEGADGDSISGRDGNNSWTLTAANIGNVALESTPSTPYANFQGIETLVGGGKDDRFNFSANGSVSGTVDGGGGNNDTLRGRNVLNIWMLNGMGAGNVALDNDPGLDTVYASFEGVENLTGGTLVDQFMADNSAGFTGTIDGLGSNDVFDLRSRTINTSVSLNNVVTGDFNLQGIERIDANTGTDNTLIGADGNNTWAITDTNIGTVVGVSFSGFNTLQGGAGNDTFQLGGDLFMVLGGVGDDRFEINLPTFTGTLSGEANSGTGNGDTLLGYTQTSLWQLNTESRVINTSSSSGGTALFNGIETLIGRDAVADTFEFYADAPTAINIDAGEQDGITDIVSYQFLDTTRDVNLSDAFDPFNGVLNAESLMGNGGSLIGDGSGYTTWILTGPEGEGTVSDGADVIGFSNFANLQGSDNVVDSFVFNRDSRFSGGLDGGESTIMGMSFIDSVDLSARTGVDDIFAIDLDDITSGYLNIESFTGNGANSTLSRSASAENAWVINSTNTGTLNAGTKNAVQFNNFANLSGGSSADTFAFNADMTGTVSGNEGDDTFTIQPIGTVSARIDGGDGDDTLLGANRDNTWRINNMDSTLNTKLLFNAVENLTGNAQDDAFVFSTNQLGGLISGGGEGTNGDSLDLIAVGGDVTVQLARPASPSDDVNIGDGDIDVVGLESLHASDASRPRVHQIIGQATGSIWDLGNGQDGQVDGINFTGFNLLQGGAGNDTFVFRAGSNYSGSIQAGEVGDNSDRDSVDYSQSGLTDVLLGRGVFGGVQEAEVIIGKDGMHLLGADATTIWTIDGANSGTVLFGREDIGFSGFGQLVGGNRGDTFNVTATGAFNGFINGGSNFSSSSDSLNISASSADFNIELAASRGGGTTTLYVTGLETLTGNLSKNHTLLAGDGGSNWAVDKNGGGRVTPCGGVSSCTGGSVSFTGFSNFSGGTGADVFTFNGSGAINGLLSGGAGAGDRLDLTKLSSDHIVELGSTVTANFNVDGVEQIDANSTTNSTLDGNGSSYTNWILTGPDEGEVSNGADVIGFSNFAKLQGSDNAVDSFVFNRSSRFSGGLDGGESTIIGMSFIDSVDLSARTDAGDMFTIDVDDATNGYLNIESFTGNGANSTLSRSASAENAWVINSINSGTLNAGTNDAVQFNNFANLSGSSLRDTFTFNADMTGTVSGNEGDDVFIVNSALSGLLDGGNHNAQDRIEYRVANASVSFGGVNNGFIFMERVDAINDGTLTNTSAAIVGSVTNWQINGSNTGTVSGLIFSGFSTLQGNSGADNFIIAASGSFDGTILAGDGVDRLSLALPSTALSGNLVFDGGNNTGDNIIISGGDSGGEQNWRGSYSPAEGMNDSRIDYSYNSSGGDYGIQYRGVGSVQDNASAANYTLNGTGGNDTLTFSKNSFFIDAVEQLSFLNKNSLSLRGLNGTDSIELKQAVTLGGTLSLDAEIISSTSLINASQLELRNFNGAGNSTSAMKINVKNLSVVGGSGSVYLDQTGGLDILQLDTAGLFNLTTTGSVSADSALRADGGLAISTSRGNISLSNANNVLGGTLALDTNATGTIVVDNNTTTRLGRTNAQSLTVNSRGAVTATGIVTVSGLSTFDAGGDLHLDNSSNDLGALAVTRANNVVVVDRNDLTLSGVSATGDIDIDSTGLTNAASMSGGTITLGAGTGIAALSGNIIASDALSVTAAGITQTAFLQSGSDLTVTAEQANINMSGASNAQGNATYDAAGDINLTSITAGSIARLKSGGRISDNNNETTNLTASTVQLEARTGIGAGDQLELQTSNLDASNGSGLVSLANTGAIDISRLHNGDNIDFSNDLDINMASGSVNANRNDLNMLTLTGSFLGLGQADLDNVDITAGDATFIGLVGTFGTFDRPLVLDVSGTLTLQTRTVIEPVFPRGEPSTINNNALITINSFDATSSIAGSQLTEIEELLEIDLAVFTAVRNYDYAQTAIRLPRDQLYEGE